MQSLSQLLLVTLAAAAAATSYTANDRSIVAVSEEGVMHLDPSGKLLSWRPEVFQWWQKGHLATNPRNGTVCWVSTPEDRKAPGVMRCALISSLNQTWDLPQPRDISVRGIDAITFDWEEENWYLTAYGEHFICSYMFDRCAKLGKTVGEARIYTAYDFQNRLQFRISTDQYERYKLEVVSLDGSGLQKLAANLNSPTGIAVDPVLRKIFVIDRANEGMEVSLYKLDYTGEGKKLVMPLDQESMSFHRYLDVFGGKGIAMYHNQDTIIAFSADGQKTYLVDGAIPGETIPALARVSKLLAVKVFSTETQREVGNPCKNTTCSDFCIPTTVNGTAEFTCLCPEGEQLVDLECRKKYPLYAVVTGGDKLQAVDMQTGEVTTILSGLTDVSKVDFFWTGSDELLLFWVDAGSLFRGRWLPRGSVSGTEMVMEGSAMHKVLDVAVDWVHRHLIWMEKDTTKSRYSKQITFVLSPFDGSYQKSISNGYGNDKRAMFVFKQGDIFGYAKDSWGESEIESLSMTGKYSWSDVASKSKRFLTSLPNDIAVDHNLAGAMSGERFFWVSAADQAVELFSNGAHSRLLSHPSLADAGGLDVLDSRLFWTERATGRLWTANSQTGGDVRVLTTSTAGGTLLLLHPWRQPARPADQTPCAVERGGCSHFCLKASATWKYVPKCLCPDGMKLGRDRKTCQ